ncbi:uncharacterized protein LOC115629494 [Scaptodrosophila lebanonensis]|uniref:Uncharacterized protein LOC115629494 n=1 Tax=Drosophila lebanonensis TaxID=7225 RepID=A0A6J2U0F4_DROLE|nr:uncharacterized protein LOC115629494 [Scaptodrosophila lebanonensis]
MEAFIIACFVFQYVLTFNQNLGFFQCTNNLRTARNVRHTMKASSSFGPEFQKVWPQTSAGLPALTDFAKQLLEACKAVKKPNTDAKSVDLSKLMELSKNFPCKFPIDTCRVMSQPKDRWNNIRHQVASAYPIIHERTLFLYLRFLEHKQKFGTAQELLVFKNMSLVDFVQRLLSKRCVSFMSSNDAFELLDGSRGSDGFENIGTPTEKPPLVIQNVLSYDEIKLSALLYVSSHSEFINNGSRNNVGAVVLDKSTIEREGVIMGLIGGRFERPNVMEWQDIMITPEQNVRATGYGASNRRTRADDYRSIWREFYEEPQDFCFDQVVVDNRRFSHTQKDFIFDNVVMKKRYAITFDTLLLECEARAVAAGKPAYVHIVGYGLGVWKETEQQTNIFLETFEERLRVLAKRLSHIGSVHFSWFHLSKWGGLEDQTLIPTTTHPNGGILVRFSNRNPADKLPENMLPIVTYAWDANALPGNEFWIGSLSGSGDPAAACSTLITELHNPHINLNYTSGANLHIASLEHGVMHIAEYAKLVA